MIRYFGAAIECEGELRALYQQVGPLITTTGVSGINITLHIYCEYDYRCMYTG